VSHISVSVITNKIRTHPILDIYALKSQRTIELTEAATTKNSISGRG
jgi:hypothetical protein